MRSLLNEVAKLQKIAGIIKEDHEVFMAHSSLKNIIDNATELMNKIGEEEVNLPAWIQDHITNSENYIDQANKGFHTEDTEEVTDDEIDIEYLQEARKKKPSSGLSKKQKSTIAKKARAGKDIGKKGKGFEKIEKAAEKEYGSKEIGKKVAAAAMWKSAAKKAKK
jgi:hypothetical protein